MKAEQFLRKRGDKLTYIYPSAKKEQIVSDFEAGDIGISEALTKYSISLSTLKSWVKAFGKTGSFPSAMAKFTKTEKRKILNEISTGKLTFREAIKRYKVGESTLYLWRKQYSDEIPCMQAPATMDQEKHLFKEGRQIEDLKLKILALETMIDEAEREFAIPIRKKFGSKQ
jgi:transposase-like protein